MAVSSHERLSVASGNKDEWLTPKWMLDALGPFDLDPCAPIVRPWDTAVNHYCAPREDGLALDWNGRVWLNPPYGTKTGTWLKKLAQHGDGIALIFARTETAMFFEYVWHAAHAVLFLKKRIVFHHVDGTPAAGNAGAPSCLVAYGSENAKTLKRESTNGGGASWINIRPS
jgi:hypothetical protein